VGADSIDSNGSNAPSLLLTALGSFVLPNGGSAWTTSLVEALGSAGIDERAARQAITRRASAGWLRGEKHGRRVRWQLTPRAEQTLREGAERIFGFGQHQPAWDGRWVLVLASIPEQRRELRYRLRVGLSWAGFGTVGPGMWISPWAERETEALDVVKGLGPDVAARSFVASLGLLGDTDDLVREAWDLATLGEGYRAFVERHRPVRPRGPAGHGAAVLRLVDDWRRFPAIDPGLPGELLPDRWDGTLAARLFAERHERWSPAAQLWWRELDATHGG
jgi:phenylacetic acid degradation operon negative regulatory protein